MERKDNVKSRKLEEVKNIIIERNIDILDLCETGWQGNSNFNNDDFRVVTCGGDSQEHRDVAIIMKKNGKIMLLTRYM